MEDRGLGSFGAREGDVGALLSGWSGDYPLSRLNFAHTDVLDQPMFGRTTAT